MKKKLLTSFLFFLIVKILSAQVPTGYYNTTKGTRGRALKTALHHIIKDHTVCSYSSLMDHFKDTDRRPDGKVWDMYSCTTNYSFGGRSERYSGEGAGYNREHSFPKSWFGGKVLPMYTDLFHIYPTDGYINNRRWHYAFGENNGETYSSEKAWSKLGVSTTPGCTDIVFEPNDEYKGDFARTYFYMATRYEDVIAGWKTLNNKPDGEKVPMLNQTSYPVFEKWALDMLLRWAAEDPVSPKEIDRNNAVYQIQHNRNPYIDFPGLELYVWGNLINNDFDPDHYEGGGITPNPDTETINTPTFSPHPGYVEAGTVITLSCTTPEAIIHYSLNNTTEQTGFSPIEITINENTDISAYAVVNQKQSETVTAQYLLKNELPQSNNVFTLVTDANELNAGNCVLIVSPASEVALTSQYKDYRLSSEVTITNDNAVVTNANTEHAPYALLLGGRSGAWTLQDQTSNKYLSLNNDNNKLHDAAQADNTAAQWNITINQSGVATIQNVNHPQRSIQYNASSPRFACYKNNTQTAVSIFSQLTVSGLNKITGQNNSLIYVYNLEGKLILKSSSATNPLHQLPAGIYIVNGHKIIVR